MKDLPKKVFISIQNAGTKNEFLETTVKMDGQDVKLGEEREIGEYELVTTRSVKGALVVDKATDEKKR